VVARRSGSLLERRLEPESVVSRTLAFTPDGGLFEGERELARVATQDGAPYPLIAAGTRSYEIARAKNTGWDFHVLEHPGSHELCKFDLARFGRGGVVVGAETSMRLRARGWGKVAWTISLDGPARIAVTRALPSGVVVDGRRRITLGSGIPPQLSLATDGDLVFNDGLAAMLAFVCWLIVQWEMLPSVEGNTGWAA
jgi:hypothetical protein